MKNIISFNEFLNENSEFTFQQFGLGGINTNNATDPTLSMDSWDRFKEQMKDQVTRLQNILNITFNSEYRKNTIPKYTIDELIIEKIFKNNEGCIDIYLTILMDDVKYWGVWKKWGYTDGGKFTSSILEESEFSDTYNKVKFTELLKKTLNNWFEPHKGNHICLGDFLVYDNMMKQHTIKSGAIVDVLTTYNNVIEIKYENKLYYIKGIYYFYFNYYFKEQKEVKYYV